MQFLEEDEKKEGTKRFFLSPRVSSNILFSRISMVQRDQSLQRDFVVFRNFSNIGFGEDLEKRRAREGGRNEIDSTWRRVSELTAPPFAINFGRGSCHGIFMPIRYPGTGSCESPEIPAQGETGGERSWSTGLSRLDHFIDNENMILQTFHTV